MKKTYIAPEMEIVKVQTVGMIATSSTMELNSTTVSGSSALSRESGGVWDDDDE